MKECKEVSHDNDDGLRVGRDDHFELSCSLCLVLYFWEKGGDRTISSCCTLSATVIWQFDTYTHTHTYGHAPGVCWCCRWGRGDSPDLWSRASALQQQSPGHISAQPGGPLLQEKPTAHCPTLLNAPQWEGLLCKDTHGSRPHTKTHRSTSLKCIPQVVDLHLRTRHSKYPFMVETWWTDRLEVFVCRKMGQSQ